MLLLPFIEQRELYDEYRFDEPWDGPQNRRLAGRMPRIYAFHGTHVPGSSVTNYLAVVGAETAWPGSRSIISADVSDGLDQTIVLVENHGAGIGWLEPRDLLLAEMDLQIDSPAGVSSPYDEPAVTLLDGSVHRLGKDLKPATLQALLTIRGGERVQPDATRGFELLPDGRQRQLREP